MLSWLLHRIIACFELVFSLRNKFINFTKKSCRAYPTDDEEIFSFASRRIVSIWLQLRTKEEKIHNTEGIFSEAEQILAEYSISTTKRDNNYQILKLTRLKVLLFADEMV